MRRLPLLVAAAGLMAVTAAGCSRGPGEPVAEAGESTPSTAPPPTTAPATAVDAPATTSAPRPAVTTGAARLAEDGFAALAGLRVGLVANPTSTVGGRHLIDLLDTAPDVELAAIFAPEHGLRGTGGGGERFEDEVDVRTGVTVFSLYGETFRPTPEMLDGLDVVLYDLQDVGTRFYTYIATMGLVMEAAAEADVAVWILDRPVVDGGELVSGFVLDEDQESFIGPYPVTAAYGMTAGELASMLVGEGWIEGASRLDLTVVPMSGWRRGMRWEDTGLEWVAPSPGLPTLAGALAYPGTVLLEATTLSYGGGTDEPFTMAGAPWLDGVALAAELNGRALPGVRFEPIEFTPWPVAGRTASPRLEGEELGGVRIVITDRAAHDPVATGVHLLDAVVALGAAADEEVIDRPTTFDLLAGTTRLRELLEAGTPAADVVDAWREEAAAFAESRRPYLRY